MDGERLVGEERPLFRGPVGIVTGIAAHPRTGALILLDANGGRLLEVLGREVCRVLADTGTIPGLRGRRSLDVTEVADPPGTVVYSVTTIPPDTDSIDDSDGILEIRDEDPTDGRFDGWEVFRP